MSDELALDAHDALPDLELPEAPVADTDAFYSADNGVGVDLLDAKQYVECGPAMFPATDPLEMLQRLVRGVDGAIEELCDGIAKQLKEYQTATRALVAAREAAYSTRITELRDQIATQAERLAAHAAARPMGQLQLVGAVADALPVNPEADRAVNQALARHSRAGGSRKLTAKPRTPRKGPTK